MIKKVLLLVNVTSGTGAAKSRMNDLIKGLNRLHCEVSVFFIVPSEGLTSEMALEDYRRDYDAIICCGGDGTLNHIIGSLYNMSIDTIIAYVPTGSANDFAQTIYGSRSIDINKLLKSIEHENVSLYDVGVFNDSFFNYVAAFGMFTNVSYDTDQDTKNVLGYFAYMLSALNSLGTNLNYREHMVLSYDGGTIEGDFILGAISNTTSIAGFKSDLFTAEDINDGLFEVTLVRATNNVSEFNDVVNCLLSGHPDGKGVLSFKTSHLEMHFTNPVGWTLDGENGGMHKDVTISIHDRKQKFFSLT